MQGWKTGKHQHWRGSQGINRLEGSPVLEFRPRNSRKLVPFALSLSKG
jgi:hypothetical protein